MRWTSFLKYLINLLLYNKIHYVILLIGTPSPFLAREVQHESRYFASVRYERIFEYRSICFEGFPYYPPASSGFCSWTNNVARRICVFYITPFCFSQFFNCAFSFGIVSLTISLLMVGKF